MGLAHLTVTADLMDKLGPAVNSGRSLFLYGPPGNGKTSLAEAISRMFGGEVFIPHCLEIDNQIIKVFDALNHIPVTLESERDAAGPPADLRDGSTAGSSAAAPPWWWVAS